MAPTTFPQYKVVFPQLQWLSGVCTNISGFTEMLMMPLTIQHVVQGGERIPPSSGMYSSLFFLTQYPSQLQDPVVVDLWLKFVVLVGGTRISSFHVPSQKQVKEIWNRTTARWLSTLQNRNIFTMVSISSSGPLNDLLISPGLVYKVVRFCGPLAKFLSSWLKSQSRRCQLTLWYFSPLGVLYFMLPIFLASYEQKFCFLFQQKIMIMMMMINVY